MAKYVATPIGSGFNSQSNLNQNFEDIEDNFQKVLYRDGSTPNQMEADLDMNSHDIINTNNIDTQSLAINGQQVVANETFVTPLPDPTGQSGKFIRSNGVSASWQTIDDTAVLRADTVAAMKALTNIGNGTEVHTSGYSTAGIGAARYRYFSTPQGTENSVTRLNQTTGGGQFVLIEPQIYVTMAGALGDGVNDTAAFTLAAAAAVGGVVICPEPGTSYAVNNTVVNANTVFIFMCPNSGLTGTATKTQLKAMFIDDVIELASGSYIGGVPTIDDFRTGKYEIIAGTIRQNAADRTKWDYIDDSNHTPVGVSGTYATASGASITINYAKTYSEVVSLVCGPDETLANKYSLSVGASVGLSSSVINVGMLRGGAMTIYYDGANWQVASGTGADIAPVVTSYTNGTLKISHNYCRGVDIAVSAWSRNGALTNPYLPLIKNVGNNFFDLQWIDTTTGNIITSASPSTRMHALVRKANNNGIFLDGTNDSGTLNLEDGNIWFYGVMKV